jgi:hypothetical protein
MPLNDQSKEWLRNRNQNKPKGIKANSQEYKDGWDRIFGGKEKKDDEAKGRDRKDTDEA